jgi:hypothetical protein
VSPAPSAAQQQSQLRLTSCRGETLGKEKELAGEGSNLEGDIDQGSGGGDKDVNR